MQLTKTDNPPARACKARASYDDIAAAVQTLEKGQGLRVSPAPTNVTHFRSGLASRISLEGYSIYTRCGDCWIVRD